MTPQKHKIVVFTPTNARVVITRNKKDYGFYKNALLDPNLAFVKTVPPHFWKQVGTEIYPMNDTEQKARLKDIERYGVINDIAPYKRKRDYLFRLQTMMYMASHWIFFVAASLLLASVVKVFYPQFLTFLR